MIELILDTQQHFGKTPRRRYFMVGERIDAFEYGGDDKKNSVLGNGL